MFNTIKSATLVFSLPVLMTIMFLSSTSKMIKPELNRAPAIEQADFSLKSNITKYLVSLK